jgi:hypothetical protein
LNVREFAGSGGALAKQGFDRELAGEQFPTCMFEMLPLWQLDIVELIGHNLEARGRDEVNRFLQTGWRLLHIYTLKYREDGVWRERPMAILGRLRDEGQRDSGGSELQRRQASIRKRGQEDGS